MEEGTDMGVGRKAAVGRRVAAYLLDNFFALLLAIPAGVLFIKSMAGINLYRPNPDGDDAFSYFVASAVLCVLPLCYLFIKDGLGNGQSLGKRIMGIKVIKVGDLSDCTIAVSALRALIWHLLCFFPFAGWLIEFILVVATADGRRIADKAAGTMVVAA